eukprot:131066_1
MNDIHCSVFILFLISAVQCDIIPNAKSTVFKGGIGCNTTISDIVLDPINYPHHVWQLNINNTIKCDTAHINVTLLNTNPLQIGYAHVFNTNGELINNHKSMVIHKNNNLTYYIQIKSLNEYKFQILCSTKCAQAGRRLLSSDSAGSSESSNEQTTTTTTVAPTTTTTTVAPTTTTIVTTTEIITTTQIITTTEIITTTQIITTTEIITTTQIITTTEIIT